MNDDMIVDGFNNEELDDFISIFNGVIKEICVFADKHNFDRDNILKYFSERMSIMSEIATIKEFKLN